MFDVLKNFFSSFFGWLKTLFKEAAKTAAGKVAESLRDIALAVCEELNYENLSGEEKRSVAFERIKQKAVEEGKEISTLGINLAIELAVAILRELVESSK